MTKLKGNFAGFISRTGLYRVWVPLREDAKGPLISIWIDPAVTAFEPDTRENPATVSSIDEKEIVDQSDEYPLCAYGPAPRNFDESQAWSKAKESGM
jgi:hypothetical protein